MNLKVKLMGLAAGAGLLALSTNASADTGVWVGLDIAIPAPVVVRREPVYYYEYERAPVYYYEYREYPRTTYVYERHYYDEPRYKRHRHGHGRHRGHHKHHDD